MLNFKNIKKLFSPDFLSGNKPFFILFFFYFFSFESYCSHAQTNLVPNGSFELYDTCPDFISQLNRCTSWYNPTTGTSDYYNSCSSVLDVSIPLNITGFQYARTGNAYTGIFYGSKEIDSLGIVSEGEYIAVRLNQIFKKNSIYRIELFVSVADSLLRKSNNYSMTGAAINHIGVLLTSDSINQLGQNLLPYLPSAESNPDIMLIDSTGWQEVEMYYLAEGGEEYLTIGFFKNKNQIMYNKLDIDGAVAGYYYLDDISITEITPEIPNIFTPNGDGTNDIFFINQLPYGYSISIYNRWGNRVFESNNEFWDGQSDTGEICSDGIYYYVIDLKEYNIKGFIQLVR